MTEASARLIRKELEKKIQFAGIIGNHPELIKNLQLVSQIADTEATIIIYGETGTGKELISHAIHENSRRSNKPFVPLNCGALVESLLESELFGYVKGAFTGADKSKQGWFEYANGGTIFLDEIHAMSPTLQMKLLRVLQTGEFSMVGDREFKKTDVRIIAATNQNLNELVEKGEFREELFYRIDVIDVTLPPLRNRPCDIPLLIDHFLKIFSRQYRKGDLQLSPETKGMLYQYDYPGNIRELRNIVERVVILSENNIINAVCLPKRVAGNVKPKTHFQPSASFKDAKRVALERFEKGYLTDCLEKSKGNISLASRNAGICITHFYSKLKQYNINPHVFKIASK